MSIETHYKKIRAEVPEHVKIVPAAKTRTPDELRQLIDAGVTDIGENYVQETEDIQQALGDEAKALRWHLIGHLQTNKINKVLGLFDIIETIDSLKLARAVNQRTESVMPVLIEINSGREPQKTGVLPEEAETVIREIATLDKLSVQGLMTMGPRFGEPEEARPYYRTTKELSTHIASLQIPGIKMDVLSMGMSNAYRIAIEEGSTLIRPGTILFGKRACQMG